MHWCGCGRSPGAKQTAHSHLNYASPCLGCSITSVCESVCLLSRPCLWPRITHFAFYVLLYIYIHTHTLTSVFVYLQWAHTHTHLEWLRFFVFVNLGNACKRFLFGSAAVYLFKFNASTYPTPGACLLFALLLFAVLGFRFWLLYGKSRLNSWPAP